MLCLLDNWNNNLHVYYVFCADTITLSDHQDVYERLVGVSVKWHDLGGALGLGQNTLKAIDVKFRGDSQDCMREMLLKRLQSGGPLSWRVLCDCLRNPTVKCESMAAEIEKDLGKQFIQAIKGTGSEESPHSAQESCFSTNTYSSCLAFKHYRIIV